MADVTIWKMDNYTYNLPVTAFTVHIENLDGPGTDRTQADGWPMFRQPQGTILNFDITVGAPTNRASGDFLKLYNDMKSFGRKDFRTLTFNTPAGPITQEMYGTVGDIVGIRFTKNGEDYWAAFTCQFIAKEAYE